MEIRPVGAELFHADGRTDRKTDRQTDRQTGRQADMVKLRVFSTILQKRLKQEACAASDPQVTLPCVDPTQPSGHYMYRQF